MLITVQGTIINTKNIFKIRNIYSDYQSYFNKADDCIHMPRVCFSIEFFNKEEMSVEISLKDLDDETDWYRDKTKFLERYKMADKKAEGMRQQIAEYWQKSPSAIPQIS